jgi:poly(A) polymerase
MTIMTLPAWMRTPPIQALYTAIPNSLEKLRFVGGCVRDALLGHEAKDIDFATSYPPQDVMAFLTKAGIKVVPTGIDHGTVMAVLEGHGYEITTLRRDVETHGRRAVVAYTDCWEEDATRRDFTFNALYLSFNGILFDPCQGAEDLKKGTVRFIGSADQRIKEDYLRILRFFRFYARFGRHLPDETTLSALSENAKGLEKISGERIHSEILRLLEHPEISHTVTLMETLGVLDVTLTIPQVPAMFTTILTNEKKWGIQSLPLARLFALVGGEASKINWLKERWKLSGKEIKWINQLLVLQSQFSPNRLSHHLYRYGPELTLSALLLQEKVHKRDLDRIHAWIPRAFPLSGEDLLKAGLTPGPKVGKLLTQLEDQWIESDFKLTKEKLLSLLL